MAGEIEEPVSFSFQVDFFHNFFLRILFLIYVLCVNFICV